MLYFKGMPIDKVGYCKYYFIEVNPTGEWGWLSSGCNIPIEKAIVEELLAV